MSSSELSGYFETWSRAVDDVDALLALVPAPDWRRPTDLAGWSVHDVVAHLAHLEHLLAGGAHDDIDVGTPSHVTGAMGTFTEQGVVARKDRSPEDLVAELRAAVTARRAEFSAAPMQDPEAPAPGLFGAIGWDCRTLLRNRPLDVWMHEQDIRRALDLPGNLDSPAARHTVERMAANLGYVLGRKAGAPAGSTATLTVPGVGTWAAEVGEDGRGRSITPPSNPTAAVTLGTADFEALVGGRRRPTEAVTSGDPALAARVVAGFHGLTP